ncbi:MAG: hypothetical protein C5B59_12385 [Bacteroidetes bacterium]|nr:MAG: hypothetical protein C5B59_12385 [Bacteroidota bacterium]
MTPEQIRQLLECDDLRRSNHPDRLADAMFRNTFVGTQMLGEIAAQLAEMNERLQRFENEWATMLRPQISEAHRQLWPKLTTALDRAAKGIFG